MNRKTDWFLIGFIVWLVAFFGVAAYIAEQRIQPASCITDSDCGCVDDCLD